MRKLALPCAALSLTVLAATVGGLLMFGGSAFAAGSVSLGSPTAAGDGMATVTITATAGQGSGIGNWMFDVSYDVDDYSVSPTCTPILGDCAVHPGGTPDVVRFAGVDGSATGITGTAEIGSITFMTNLAAGSCSAVSLTITSFQDGNGTDIPDVAITNGQVCAAVATPTLTPAPLPYTGPPIVGDVTGDGYVTPADALVIALEASGLPGPAALTPTESRADADCSGDLTGADAVSVLRHFAGLPQVNSRSGCPQLGQVLRCGFFYPTGPDTYGGWLADRAELAFSTDGSVSLSCIGSLYSDIASPASEQQIDKTAHPALHCTVDPNGGPGGTGLYFSSYDAPGKTDDWLEVVQTDRTITLTCHYQP